MTGEQYSSGIYPSSSFPHASSGSYNPTESSGNLSAFTDLTIAFKYGSSMVCAICGKLAEQTVQQGVLTPMYFAVYDTNSKGWSKPPGGDGCLVHPSKGHACGEHLSRMQEMQNDWANTPHEKRWDRTFLYCFANYYAHKEFAESRGEAPVQG